MLDSPLAASRPGDNWGQTCCRKNAVKSAKFVDSIKNVGREKNRNKKKTENENRRQLTAGVRAAAARSVLIFKRHKNK